MDFLKKLLTYIRDWFRTRKERKVREKLQKAIERELAWRRILGYPKKDDDEDSGKSS